MKRSKQTGWQVAVVAMALGGCGDDSQTAEPDFEPSSGFTNIVGGLASDDGAQRVGALADGPFTRTARIRAADTVVIWSARRPGQPLSTAPIKANGTFQIEGIAPQDGPFIIDALSGDDRVGQVLVPGPQGGAGFTVAMPISTETSVEVEAYLALLDEGVALQDVDLATLTEGMTRQMATRVEHGAELAPGAWAAQAAFVNRLRDEGLDVTHADLAAARSEAYNDLAGSIAEGRSVLAWRQYGRATEAAFEGLGAGVALQAEAAQAARFAAARVRPEAVAEAADALAACTFAEYAARSQVYLARRIDPTHAVADRIEAEYADYQRVLAQADGRAAVLAARRELTRRMVGGGVDSMLGVVLSRSLGDVSLRLPAVERLPTLFERVEADLVEGRRALQDDLIAVREVDTALAAIDAFRIVAGDALRAHFGTGIEGEIKALAVDLLVGAEVNLSALGGVVPVE